MTRHCAQWWVRLLAGALVCLLFAGQPVHADDKGITIFSITQQDTNGDGQPDLTIIDCAFATAHDRIYVVDQGSDMRTSTDWQKATDFSDDIWLYDIGAKGAIQLIVVYRVEDGHATAYVYDDQNGDGQVSYERTGTQVKILESPDWTARISSNADWFLPDGRINLNVRIDLDGPIPTLDRAPQDYIQDYMKHDGIVDVEFEAVAGPDGIAQYALRRLVAPSPPDSGFGRTWLWSNEGHYPTQLPERAFFPFLPIPIDVQHDPRYANVRYFDLPPDLNVDWPHGKITAVELAGYPIGHGYHFNDNRYIVKGQVNDLSFESPQAYYDLANNHDAFAELHIRFFTRPANDPTMWSLPGTEAVPWQSISYDWNEFNPGTLRWDFKVGLGGTYPIDSVVRFPDFAVRTVPFEQLPRWITERAWKLTTFLAREGTGYESSEGLYEWQTDTGDDPEVEGNRALEARDATAQYMLGVTSTPPDAYFTTAHPGFRAERHFAGPIQPFLYFSPIDRKLHLRGAEAGLWNIDDQHLLRYANLYGGPYLDQWQYLENGVVQRQLNSAEDYLTYSADGEVVLKRAAAPPALFETLPPTNHEQWAELRAKLDADKPDFAPGDFKAMLEPFDGPQIQISGASLHDYRPIGKHGFRFVLDLQPGFQVQGTNLLAVSELQPGSYAVSYDGTFKIEPLTAPALSASLLATTLTQFERGLLPIALHNDGLADVPAATLELWATSPRAQVTLVATRTLSLLSQVPLTPTLQWVPPAAGSWTLTPKVRQSDGQLISFVPIAVTVLPPKQVAPGLMIATSTTSAALPFILGGLMVFAALVTAVFRWQWRSVVPEQDEDTA